MDKESIDRCYYERVLLNNVAPAAVTLAEDDSSLLDELGDVDSATSNGPGVLAGILKLQSSGLDLTIY